MKIRELFEDKSDYVAKTFGEKLVSALMRDDSEDAKKLKKGMKGVMPAGAEADEAQKAKVAEAAAKIVAELIKVDPKFDDATKAQKERLEQEVAAAEGNLTLKVAKEKELRKVAAKLSGPADKYLVWIARMYTTGQFKLEDISRIRGEIITFEKNLGEIQNKDLNSYKTLNDLYNVTDKFAAKEAEPEVKKDEPEAEKDVEWLIYTPNYKALIPKSEEASCKYGLGTRWCTAATGGYNHYKSYASRGDLVIIMCKIDGKTRKFQFHFETHSFMDERDQKATKEDIKGLSKHPEHVKLLHMLIDKHLGPDEE
jgi:hypothetical protein